MIESIYIRNFKAWKRGVFKTFGRHAVLIGENESGKTSILQALDFFFNRTYMDASCVADPKQDVQIGVRIDGRNYRKVFDSRTLRARPLDADDDWEAVRAVRYIYVPSGGIDVDVAAELLSYAWAQRAVVLGEDGAQVNDVVDDVDVDVDAADDADAVAVAAATDVSAEAADGAAVFREAVQAVRGLMGSQASLWDPVIICDAVNGARLLTTTRSADHMNRRGDARRTVLGMLQGSRHANVVLGVDDVEDWLLRDGDGEDLLELQRHVGQLLAVTSSAQMAVRGNDTLVYPVGEPTGANVAAIIADAGADLFPIFVEGQYDLPWYRCALRLLGVEDRYWVLPGGGSNIDVLFREFRARKPQCAVIRDGDMSSKANPAIGDYALELDCIEMYAPDQLLYDCFGVNPSRHKDVFFRQIIDNAANFSPECKGNKSHFSPDDIKSIIADRIEQYLDADSVLVRELSGILEDIERRS